MNLRGGAEFLGQIAGSERQDNGRGFSPTVGKETNKGSYRMDERFLSLSCQSKNTLFLKGSIDNFAFRFIIFSHSFIYLF